jgi:hypothetical protein
MVTTKRRDSRIIASSSDDETGRLTGRASA